MLYMDRLLELLDKALHGAESGCQTTAKAYLKMARTEWYQLIDEAPPADRDKFRTAALFIDRIVSRQTSLTKAAQVAFDFWTGFEDGWNERTLPGKANAYFRRGYRYGKEGS